MSSLVIYGTLPATCKSKDDKEGKKGLFIILKPYDCAMCMTEIDGVKRSTFLLLFIKVPEYTTTCHCK